MKRVLLLLVIAGVALVILFPLLQKPGVDRRFSVLEEYTLTNSLSLVTPPSEALQDSSYGDPVRRIASRLTWGTPGIVAYTLRHLPEDPETRRRLARELESTLARLVVSSPLTGRTVLQALGELSDPGSVPVLLEHAQGSPDFLSSVAIKALTQFPATNDILDALALLSGSNNPHIHREAERAIVSAPDFWDPPRIVSFLDAAREMEGNNLMEEVGLKAVTDASVADAIARQLDSPLLNVRQVAIRALMRVGDPRGAAEAEQELMEQDPTRVYQALTIYRDSGRVPSVAAIRRLSRHEGAQVRQGLAESLRLYPGETEDTEAAILEVLVGLTDDRDAAVRTTAIAQLYFRGKHLGLETYRDDLREGHGGALKESVQFLCEQLGDPVAADLIRARLRTEIDPTDAANLLFGLRFVGDADDAAQYVDFVVRGGTEQDARGSGSLYLSQFAALYVQDLGPGALDALALGFERCTTDVARLMILDALRGIASETGPDCVDLLERLATDRALSLPVRLEVIRSFPFIDDPGTGPRFLALREDLADHQLSTALLQVYVSYY